MRKSKFLLYDAFSKTEEDVRIRTNSGGFITLGCVLTAMILLYKEWVQLTEVVTRPQLYVDRDSEAKLELNFDITFPSISCDVLTLDIVDEAGDLQLDLLDSGFTKTRVSADGTPISTEDYEMGQGVKQKNNVDYGAEYCGSCYGSIDQTDSDNVLKEDRICCQTCDDVHARYIDAGWAFFDGENIDQCEREGYVSQIKEHLHEGCRVQGSALLSRVQGNIHFAPGKSYQDYKNPVSTITHFHDTSLYYKTRELNFNHIIHHLSFGKPIGHSHKNIKAEGLSKISRNPLDGREVIPERDSHLMLYSYFAKIVPTRYEYLNDKHEPVETTQFSATFHSRPLAGGRDEDHPTTYHGRGGIPGVFFYYEMSSLKVINREQHAQTWSGFFLNCITTIGGILAVGTVVDKVSFGATKQIWGKKSQ